MMNPLTRMNLESVSKRLEQLLVSDLITIQLCNGVDETRIEPYRITDRTTDRITDRIADQITDQITNRIKGKNTQEN